MLFSCSRVDNDLAEIVNRCFHYSCNVQYTMKMLILSPDAVNYFFQDNIKCKGFDVQWRKFSFGTWCLRPFNKKHNVLNLWPSGVVSLISRQLCSASKANKDHNLIMFAHQHQLGHIGKLHKAFGIRVVENTSFTICSSNQISKQVLLNMFVLKWRNQNLLKELLTQIIRTWFKNPNSFLWLMNYRDLDKNWIWFLLAYLMICILCA